MDAVEITNRRLLRCCLEMRDHHNNGRQHTDDSQLVGWQSTHCMACTFGMLVASAVTVVKTGKKTAMGWYLFMKISINFRSQSWPDNSCASQPTI
ncbi:NF-kappa-B inhibitor epsilon [Trichinella spiralis]|uniref:NF-kappa-B inhibitor epsilon n=1 Tax=Trichinella spiralis TaxID=6334 RepID=A0ABR3KYA3_TRISP